KIRDQRQALTYEVVHPRYFPALATTANSCLLSLVLGLCCERRNPVSACSTSTKDAMLAQIPNLRAFAYSLCGRKLADDMVQETLLRAWRHLDSFQEG